MSNTETLKSILKNKKFVLLLIVLSLFLIILTALISTYIVKKRAGYEYLAVINEDLSFNKTILLEKQNSICNLFDAKAYELPKKYQKITDQAHIIEFETNELVGYIDEIIEEIIDDCGGKDNDYTESMEDKSDFSSANNILEHDRDASELHKYIVDYKEMLLLSINDTYSPSYKYVNENLNFLNSLINNEYRMDQEVLYSGMPSVATINLLLQLQIKIRLSAIETMQYMLSSFESLDVSIGAIGVYTGEQNGKLYTGDTFDSKIGLLAIDTTTRPVVYVRYSEPFYDSTTISGYAMYRLFPDKIYDTLPFTSGEGITLKINCTKSGKYYYGGLIHYKSNRGEMWLPFKEEYIVQ